MTRKILQTLAFAALPLVMTSNARADIKVGVILSMTGPAASLGIPERKAIELSPKKIAGQKVQYIFKDDGTDPTAAVKAAKELIDDDKVDIVVGPSITPNAMAMIDIMGTAHVPNIALAAGRSIVFPMDAKRQWMFIPSQSTELMAKVLIKNMLERKLTKAAFIGFDDAYGEDWYNNFSALAKQSGIDIVANERYSRIATSVMGQVLHIVSAQPQAVLIAGAGTPAALPQRALKQVGYKGQIYQTHGVANPEFLKICGTDCDGTILPLSPGVVASQLPADSPLKQSGMQYAQSYEAAYGKGSLSQFSADAWDGVRLIEAAIPKALEQAKPDDVVAFRAALRTALENVKDVAGAEGIYVMTPSDHNGLDDRAAVLGKIENEQYVLVK